MLTNSRDIIRRLLQDAFEQSINMQAGNSIESVCMPHYVAIVEDAGPETAIGIWFPDLPGCFSAGDDVDQDPNAADDLHDHMVALVAMPEIADAAE